MSLPQDFKPAHRLFPVVGRLMIWLGLAGVLYAQPLGAPLPEDLLPELKGYLETAIAQSPAMIDYNINLAQAEANRYSNSAGLYPGLTASGSGGETVQQLSQGSGAPSKSFGFGFALGLNQALFHFGTHFDQADIGRIGVKIAEKNFAEAYRQLAVTIRSKYMDLIVQKATLRFLQFNLDQTATNLGVAEDNFKNGRISPDELADARLNLEETRLSCDRSRTNYEQARRVFQRIVGLDQFREESIPAQLPKAAFSEAAAAALLGDFLRNGPAATYQGRIYADTIKQTELAYKIAKYRLYPELGFSAGLGQSNQSTVNGSSVSQSTIISETYGLAVSWTIFDGLATRGAKLSALAAKRSAEQSLKNYTMTAAITAQAAEQSAALSARAMALAETRRERAETRLQSTSDDFKAGRSAQSALDAAQANLYRAEFSTMAARADFLTNWAAFISTVSADPALNLLPARYK